MAYKSIDVLHACFSLKTSNQCRQLMFLKEIQQAAEVPLHILYTAGRAHDPTTDIIALSKTLPRYVSLLFVSRVATKALIRGTRFSMYPATNLITF
jgi:hypothetical protein